MKLKITKIHGTKTPPAGSDKTWVITYFTGLDEENSREYDKLGTFYNPQGGLKEGMVIEGEIKEDPDHPERVPSFEVASDKRKGGFRRFTEDPAVTRAKAEASARQTAVNSSATLVASIIAKSTMGEDGKFALEGNSYSVTDLWRMYRDEAFRFIAIALDKFPNGQKSNDS